jgi:threonine dehydratase
MKTLTEAIRPTVFLEPQKLRDLLGIDLTIATETFQHTGSFKFRAAYNVVLNVPHEHVVAASSGNFGQALAYACKLAGKKCTVVMPENSAAVKVDAVRNYGATADLIDTKKISRSDRVAELAASLPDVYVTSAYDDQFVIDGNSSLADELAPRNFDCVVVPVGGGGLISGLSKGLCRNGSQTTIIGAEPLLGNDAARSVRSGELVANESEPQTLADGARTLSLGKLNWEIIRPGVKEIIEVSDDNLAEAVRLYFAFANLKSEPTGALSLGAVLAEKSRFDGLKVCLIVSGGNVDAAIYSRLIAG